MNITPTKSMPQLAADLVAQFASIVGPSNAVTDAQDLISYVTEERNLFKGHSTLVLRPGSTAEVSEICKLASVHRVALVPQGGNTGLVGGQTPHNGEVVVSLRRMDKVRDLDIASNTMTCEAGVVLQNAQQRAADVDRLFPLSLGAEGSCTIGGNLSTNAGGTAALAYGVAREMALGVEVVLADGRILNALSKLKKDNTGYDLRDLFIGAEGTLGIITAATLKLFPKPRAIETAFVGLSSPEAALKLLAIAQAEAAGSLTSFELLAEICIDFCVKHGPDIREPLSSRHPWYVLLELSSPRDDARATLESILSRGMAEGAIDDATIAANLTQRAAFWKLREVISPAQKPEGGSIKHDVSVPVAAVPAFIAEADSAVVKLIPGSRPVPFGHLGDGNIHYGCVNNDAPEDTGTGGTATGGSATTPTAGTSSGGTGSGTAGTATGAGGAAAAKPHTCAMVTKASETSPVITDFEGMANPTSGFMFESAGVTGGTYIYTDTTDAASTSKLMFSAGHAEASTQALDGQIHNATWGGGMGLWFGCIDASVYTGVTFWARGASPAGKVRVNLTIDEAVMVKDGGICPDAGPCVRPFTEIDVTDEWQEFTLAWGDFMPGDKAGTALPGDTVTAINGLDFGLPNDNTARDLELAVDDFAFSK